MDEKELDSKLRELIGEVANLPKEGQKKLKPLIEETKQRQKEIKEDVNKINKSLEDLRICVKYLIFDLEATRRERDKLKALLNNKPKNDDDGPDTISGEM